MKVGADWPLWSPPCTPVAPSPVHPPHSLQGRGPTWSPHSPNPGFHLSLLWLEPCSPDSHRQLFPAHVLADRRHL